MSKRFGRNQKRKMKEQLALQEKKINKLEANRQEYSELKYCVELTAKVLGRYFVTLPPERRIFDKIPKQIQHMLHDSSKKWWSASDSDVSKITYTINLLNVILTDIEFDYLRNAIHFRVSAGYNDNYAYSMSNEAIAMIPIESLIEHMASTLSKSFLSNSENVNKLKSFQIDYQNFKNDSLW